MARPLVSVLLAGKHRRRVAAGEADRAGIARGRVVVGVLPTVTVKVSRAGAWPPAVLTTKCVAAAGVTVTALLLPVMVLVAVSVAVNGLVARGLQRDAERAGAAGQGAVGRQHGGGVAAGEVDRAAIARRRVVVGVLRGHRHRTRGARRALLGAALTAKCVAAPAPTAPRRWCR